MDEEKKIFQILIIIIRTQWIYILLIVILNKYKICNSNDV